MKKLGVLEKKAQNKTVQILALLTNLFKNWQ
jgi:hypothetical protein